MPDETRFLDELDRSITHLVLCVENRDERRTWAALLESLSWVFRAEQAIRKGRNDYYEKRANHANGNILAGLIYFRGEVDHAHQEEPYTVDWVRTPLWTRVHGGDWVESKVMARGPGKEWRDADIRVQSAVFPVLHPDATKDPKYRRDELYRDRVQGHALTVVLGKAAAFLRSVVDEA